MPTNQTKKEKNTKIVRVTSMLEAFEQIVELAEGSKLSANFFKKASPYIKYVSQKLELSEMQSVLLALFVSHSDDYCIKQSRIADDTGCSNIKILQLSPEIDVLEKKHYIRVSRSNGRVSYRVPLDVQNALIKNEPYVYVETPINDPQSFFEYFSDLSEEIDNGELTHKAILERTNDAISKIADSHFSRTLSQFKLVEEERLLFIFMAHIFVDNCDDDIHIYQLEGLYDNQKLPYWCKDGLRKRSLSLFEHKLIENANEDGMANANAFKLTDYAKNDLLSELDLNIQPQQSCQLTKCSSFPEKRLIYNASERAQVKELSAILSADRFHAVQKRLRDAKMRTGFCCLFYGAPGTGKTETVYQIARATGRDILRVDVDKIKSCWVGESEQNIKRFFDIYRKACKQSKVAPIMLFNEADAILGVRMEGATRAVDKMENSIQNIILQEMESLEGIMIATTNITANLDKAFERRFLYKIKFNRPTIECRAQIWQLLMPALTLSDANTLASKFDMSGGEIENISRKYAVNAILSGEDSIDIQSIIEICKNERIANKTCAQIGFRL